MEYVFSSKGGAETLKTKGSNHSGLREGERHEVVREYPDQTITDSFTVIRLYRSATDAEGNCYDWYMIKDHYRYTDKFTPGIGATEQEITELEIATMEQEQAITDNEIAILELQERIGDDDGK